MSISVVMCIHSEPVEWLKSSIQSIIQQSFIDFEFIVVNDNPHRELNRQLLAEYARKESRVTVIHNEENIGLTRSLNIGLSVARGKYIARMDADDISIFHRLQVQYDFMESNPEYILCGSDAWIIDEKGEKVNKGLNIYFEDQKIREIFPILNPMCHPSLFMNRSVLNQSRIKYNETYRYAQDYEIIRELLNCGKVCNLSTKLLKYRKSPDQISRSKFSLQHKYANQTRLRYMQDIFDAQGCSAQEIYKQLKLVSKDKIVYNSLLSLLTNFDLAVDKKEYYMSVLSFRYSLRDSLKLVFRSLK
ncbi:glycosyltransferase family 2 protein [Sinomicrobium weinanense]|uniref:Glycosyltransferase family 2 protein n=1 Tax=Sinomicrobium weinanense TaxID=2842200 RepID=A0A926JUG9_9FLAO|nr:glycosyltransferase family 2 protein [Sinomicrobium weinanense]MBC9797457.1 glycosyltransferase family 2 protein [Sinomicrobium weinanense]MBU3125475.1 glycosyltransferase [Sinomicrobium weinanense]